jgi:hypothetical protein
MSMKNSYFTMMRRSINRFGLLASLFCLFALASAATNRLFGFNFGFQAHILEEAFIGLVLTMLAWKGAILVIRAVEPGPPD